MEKKEKPLCAMCFWWIPRDGEARNTTSKGTCTAVQAPFKQERDTMGWQCCALFDDFRQYEP